MMPLSPALLGISRWFPVYTAAMHRMTRVGIAAVLVVSAGLALSCSNTTRSDADHPLTRMRNPGLSKNNRVEALDEAWKLGEPGTPDRQMTRDAMKDLVWSAATPMELRLKIMGKMLDSTDPAEAKDARDMAKLMLPRERSRTMVTLISDVAGARGWEDFIPALVRSYSRQVPEVKDDLRSERVALDRLANGVAVEQLVFDVFVKPPPAEETYGVNWQERMRTDAWDLLGRLDADGSMRVKLVSDLGAKGPTDDAVLTCLQNCFNDLRAIPLTGEELKWALSLKNPKKPDNAPWWTKATAAIAQTNFETTGPLVLRHAEPIRWAAEHQSSWLSLSRAELKSELLTRLENRAKNTRSNETPNVGRPYQEQVNAWDDKLRWGDFLTILVLDEALKESTLPAQMLRHAELDRRDTTTEYGGILRVADISEAPAQFAAVLFPPRPAQRTGDTQFIASDDMLAASDRTLAHYHFHAQAPSNRIFAGPSLADLQYAKRMGRSCLVFTSVKEGSLGIDYYQPNGAVVDLGEMNGVLK